MPLKTPFLALFIILYSLFFPPNVSAHAFGKLYNLPVPFWLYLYGGAATIIVSFFIIGYFFNKTNQEFSYPTINLSKYTFFKLLNSETLILTIKIISLLLFFLTITAGLFGVDSAYVNFNMTFFWIIFVLGVTYLTALIGDFYIVTNPWKTAVEWTEALTRKKIGGFLNYPKKLAYWPALAFYFLFIWIELFGQTTPHSLSIILIQYTVLNLIGLFIFGKDAWFKYGEFFSVFFRLIGKISPIEARKGRLVLRPPFVGLLNESVQHFSLLLFILFMLSSTAFDGFRETTPFFRLYWQYFDGLIRPVFGENSNTVFQTLGLLLSPIVFLLIFLLLTCLAKLITKSKTAVSELLLQFGYSLIPIALVYNIAHYFTLLLTQGQEIIRLVSDPFGFGWNLLGTYNYTSNLTVVGANTTWHTQVAFILFGHIAGVYLAHVISLRVFPTHKRALISQIPMLILMISYTTAGLWILSQPIRSGI